MAGLYSGDFVYIFVVGHPLRHQFKQWEQSIPKDAIYDKFREFAATVHRFEDQIFAYWDWPIAISNGYTECTNRLIRENNLRGRGYSFEVLRARTLYRKIQTVDFFMFIIIFFNQLLGYRIFST